MKVVGALAVAILAYSSGCAKKSKPAVDKQAACTKIHTATQSPQDLKVWMDTCTTEPDAFLRCMKRSLEEGTDFECASLLSSSERAKWVTALSGHAAAADSQPKTAPPTGQGPDFNALASKAYPENAPPNQEVLDQLWIGVFKLPQWHFLMTPKSMADGMKPSLQKVHDIPSLLVFTDSEKLRTYAAANQNLVAGKALSLDMTPDAARAFLVQFSGTIVVGVRFNEGSGGWFASLQDLSQTYDGLKKAGKL